MDLDTGDTEHYWCVRMVMGGGGRGGGGGETCTRLSSNAVVFAWKSLEKYLARF